MNRQTTERFPLLLTEKQRQALIEGTRVPVRIKKLLQELEGKQPLVLSRKELERLSEMTEAAIRFIPGWRRQQLLTVMNKIGRLLDAVDGKPAASKRVAIDKNTVFQFKITLQGIDPPIWRRIQTKDCTLDKLHEHIQTAMGWTNSHLHQFIIKGVIHGDPELIYEGWEDEESPVDSRRTKLSQIVPKNGKRFRFTYEYDFGDDWEHEILFEGFPPAQKGARYPLCVEGERACPPEDVGGTYGYQEYLEALSDPEHEEHESYLEWVGGFNPEAFDAQAATKEMRNGLPDWRDEID